MRRGDIWRYTPVIQRGDAPALRLIVSADGINAAAREDAPALFAVHVLTSDPGRLLAVRVDPHGWASVMTLGLVLRSRLTDHVDTAEPAVMEQVDSALRAALDL